MFENVGGKIKSLAVVVFVLTLIASVVIGLISIDNGGILFIIIGSVVSWISALFTYGLGELIESTSENRDTSLQILKELKSINESKEAAKPASTPVPEQKANPSFFSQEPKKSETDNASELPFKCGMCGHPGNYEGKCPRCGSSVKKYNN